MGYNKASTSEVRIRVCACVLAAFTLVASLCAGANALAFRAPDPAPKPNLDVRLPASRENRGGFILRLPTATQALMEEALEREVPGLVLYWDGMSASPQWISAPPGGALSTPSAGRPEEAARTFLRSRAALFGLQPREIDALRVSSVVPPGSVAAGTDGGTHVHFKQIADGLEVFDAGADVNLRSDLSVESIGSHLYAGARHSTLASLEAIDAVRAAVADVYPDLFVTGKVLSAETGDERRIIVDEPGFGRPPEAKLVLFPEASGVRLAWLVRVAERTLYTDYEILVDALDGSILFRRNFTKYASARVLQAGYPSPQTEETSPSQYTLSTIPSSTSESPFGWISSPGTSLTGNNSTSHLGYFTDAGLSESSGIYDYPYDTPRSQLVNAWWWANDAHDRFRVLGFDEAHGNFQASNFGLPGVQGDPMRVVSWTAGGRNNAFNSTESDGSISSINFFWTSCSFCGDHDGYPENGGDRATGFMRDVIVHEFTHGVTTRMVGGPAVVNCLLGIQSGAMGEGWSDIFPASFFGDPTTGAHFFEGLGWLRDARHDMNYSNLCAVGDFGCEVHDDGMIWVATLWDLRSSLIALDPAGGRTVFERIVVDGLNNTVCHPTFINARDGILSADTTLYASAHHRVIWNVFASRRMGQGASSSGENDTAPVTSITVPAGFVCVPPAAPTGVTAATDGTNGIRVNYTATGASAVEIWREDIDNTLDRPARISFTTSTTSYLDGTVQGGKTYRYHTVALGAAGITCRSGNSATGQATATGACSEYPRFDSSLAIADGALSCTLTLSWSAASQGCPGQSLPIVYNVYRAARPGFEPSDALMIGRTSATTFQDEPPQNSNTYYYLVLAQHGTLSDPADHRARGISQTLKWVPRTPTLGRTQVQFWDFNATNGGWTADNSADFNGGWIWVDPNGTRYADGYLNPELASGGAGKAWVTGDAAGATATSKDSDNSVSLSSPLFDATGGKTILSFDYWAHMTGNFFGGIEIILNNGSTNVTVPLQIGLMGVQPFDTLSDRGWQRAELDISKFITPTASMKVTFASNPGGAFSEFGIDNVKMEQATVCGRSSLRVSSVSVIDTPPGWGNGNGVLDPGETVRLTVQLTNDSATAAVTPTGTMTTRAPGLLIHEPNDTFPTIAGSGGTGSSLGSGFTVTAPAATACGGPITVDFLLTDSAGTASRASWNLETGRVVTDVVFSDTFETDLGWYNYPGAAGPGQGVWQRGDPVGTMDGANQANPENDSPNDVGAQCYVTENGLVGGAVNATDVDTTSATLVSPYVNLAGYKRARAKFDLWYYDNSSSTDYWQDFSDDGAFVNDSILDYYDNVFYTGDKTNGWASQTRDLNLIIPMTSNVRLYFEALDQAPDHVVEAGVDNVKVEGDRPVCDASPILNPPNPITTLMVDRVGGSANLTWTPPPVDGSHHAAAYYRFYVSGSPGSGFSLNDTMTLLAASRPLVFPSEFYTITAVNSAGTSGDEPAP